MNTYRVVLEVDYLVEANSLDEAQDIVLNDSEHPLVGGYPNSYCEDTRIKTARLANGVFIIDQSYNREKQESVK
jgi:hypothetical protein